MNLARLPEGECRGSKPTCVGLDGTSASRLWRLARTAARSAEAAR